MTEAAEPFPFLEALRARGGDIRSGDRVFMFCSQGCCGVWARVTDRSGTAVTLLTEAGDGVCTHLWSLIGAPPSVPRHRLMNGGRA